MEKRLWEMINSDVEITKYPKASFIMFSREHAEGDDSVPYYCAWYNKVGKNPKYIVSRPPEWQKLTKEEALKIAEKFGGHTFLCMNYMKSIELG